MSTRALHVLISLTKALILFQSMKWETAAIKSPSGRCFYSKTYQQYFVWTRARGYSWYIGDSVNETGMLTPLTILLCAESLQN